jgi:hypothetical protein
MVVAIAHQSPNTYPQMPGGHSMNGCTSPLFDAFHSDHAELGRGLYEIETELRGHDIEAAKAAAERLDRDGGAHIVFEEQYFYPALRRLLGGEVVDRFYREHGEGLDLIQSLVQIPAGDQLTDKQRRELISDAEVMERHVVECGELFGAMGRIPPEEQKALHAELLRLRELAPRWTEVGGK